MVESMFESSFGLVVDCPVGSLFSLVVELFHGPDIDWDVIFDEVHNPDFRFSEPQYTYNCSLRAFLGPELNLSIYGIIGPYANLESYLELLVDLQTDWWELHGGVDANIGVGAKLLGFVIL